MIAGTRGGCLTSVAQSASSPSIRCRPTLSMQARRGCGAVPMTVNRGSCLASSSTIRSVLMNSDHADETIVADPNPMGEIVTLAIDPTDSQTLVAGAVNKSISTVFLSKDAGSTWDRIRDLPDAPQKIWIDSRSNRAIAMSISPGREASRFDTTGSGKIGLRPKMSPLLTAAQDFFCNTGDRTLR